MTDIIAKFPGKKARKAARKKRKTLCRSDFHKWSVDKQHQFDVKAGRLVTVERCTRCGKTRNVLR